MCSPGSKYNRTVPRAGLVTTYDRSSTEESEGSTVSPAGNAARMSSSGKPGREATTKEARNGISAALCHFHKLRNESAPIRQNSIPSAGNSA